MIEAPNPSQMQASDASTPSNQARPFFGQTLVPASEDPDDYAAMPHHMIRHALDLLHQGDKYGAIKFLQDFLTAAAPRGPAQEYPKWVPHPDNPGMKAVARDEGHESQIRQDWGVAADAQPEYRDDAAKSGYAAGPSDSDRAVAAGDAGPRDQETADIGMDHDELVKCAQDLGIKVDKRWSDDRLRQEIEDASAPE